MKKRWLSVLLALALCQSGGALANSVSHEAPFPDVKEEDWFREEVERCRDAGLLVGPEDTVFRPDEAATRGQVIQALYQLEGRPAPAGEAGFTDVPSDSPWADAVNWAAEQKVAGGWGDGSFRPEAPVTREQLAAILHRYAQLRQLDVSVGENTNILSYLDVFDLSDWAYPPMQWACGSGVIRGWRGYIRPDQPATRAETAVTLCRFLDLL